MAALQRLMVVLEATGSHEAGVRKEAEAALRLMEAQPAFLIALLQVSFHRKLSRDIRLAAIIQLKNQTRSWRTKRRTCNSPTGAAMKSVLEQVQTQLLTHQWAETDNLVAVQLALVTAKIARADWPKSWPGLIPVLASAVQQQQGLPRRRALMCWHQVLKELHKTPMARGPLVQVCVTLVPTWRTLWTQSSTALIGEIQRVAATGKAGAEDIVALTELTEMTLLVTKCTQRVVVFGVLEPDQSPEAQALFPEFLRVCKVLLSLRTTLPPTNPLHKPVTKMIVVIAKTITDSHQRHPLHFRRFLLPFFQFFFQALQGTLPGTEKLDFARLHVHGLTFLSVVLRSGQKGSVSQRALAFESIRKVNLEAADATRTLLEQVLKPDLIKGLTQMVIYRFFQLDADALRIWKDSPEEFLEEELQLAAENKRFEAAKLLLETLLSANSATTVATLMGLLDYVLKQAPVQVHPAPGTPQWNSLLLKEAVYLALGKSAEQLADVPNFAHQWFRVLGSELQHGHPVVVRRAVWALGEWAKFVPASLRPSIYSGLDALLGHADMVVRLTALGALRRLVEDEEFHATLSAFMPHVASVIEKLFKLVAEVEKFNTRKFCVSVLRQLVEGMNEHVRSFVPVIIKHLPSLWQSCNDPSHNLLRQSIAITVKNLVTALGPDSVQLHFLVIPILQFSTDPKNAEAAYMQESALELWAATLHSTPSMSQGLLDLFGNWLALHADSVENLDKTFPVLESYVYLGGRAFLDMQGGRVAHTLLHLLKQVRFQFHGYISSVLEIIAQLFPRETPVLFRGCLQFMVGTMVGLPGAEAAEDSVTKGYFHIFARLFYEAPDAILSALSSMCNNPQMMGVLLTKWTAVFDCMDMAYNRQLSCLALLRWLQSTQDNAVLEQLPAVLAVCTSILVESTESRASLPDFSAVRQVAPERRTEAIRIQLIAANDTAPGRDIKECVRQTMQSIAQRTGPQVFQRLLSTVDPLLLKDFK